MIKLHKYQEIDAHKIYKGLESETHQILSFYTGAGKTEVIFEVIDKLLKANRKLKIGISSHWFRELKNQTFARAQKKFGNLVFKSQRGEKISLDHSIYVFNPQFLMDKKSTIKFDYLFVDEFHYGYANRSSWGFDFIMKEWCKPKCKYVWISATPEPIFHKTHLKKAPIFSRGIDFGYRDDGRVSDFNIKLEKYDFKLKRTDFEKSGEIKGKFFKEHGEAYTQLCLNKIKRLLGKKKLGKKVMIICPPGDQCRTAETINLWLNDNNYKSIAIVKRSTNEIEFKADDSVQFACVVRKCQEGFDFPELTDIVDLTMTKNVRVLTQRIGRLARKHEEIKNKNYYYIFDQTIKDERVEWLFVAAINYGMGEIVRPSHIWSVQFPVKRKRNWSARKFTLSFKEILFDYKKENIEKFKTISFNKYVFKPPRKWTPQLAKIWAKRYKGKSDIAHNDRSLYNYLMEHKGLYKEIFGHVKTKWTAELAIEEARRMGFASRNQFKKKLGGAYGYLEVNKQLHLLDDVLPKIHSKKWTLPLVQKEMKKYKKRSEFKKLSSGAHNWLLKNGKLGELDKFYQKHYTGYKHGL